MKPVYKEFKCQQCRELRYINVNGICFDCNNKKTLISLAKKRKSQQKLEILSHSISLETLT
ncbi:MAG: hypothetical protein ACFE9Z_05950 [Promethearchaeota archaeon]